MGAPFFAWGCGGIARLCGPTGGYLLGMLLAMIFVVVCRERLPRLITLCLAGVIVFLCGLTQLSLYLPHSTVLAAGLYPFIVGDMVKILVAWVATMSKPNRS